MNTILRGGICLFATLIVIEDIQSLLRFVEADQTSRRDLDSILYLEEDIIEKYIEKYILNEDQKKHFLHSRWMFLAPDISPDRIFWKFEDSIILPFLTKTPLNKKGGFCDISVFRIHEQCSKIPSVSGAVSTLTDGMI